MKRRMKVLAVLGLLAVMALAFAGCAVTTPDIEIAGTWHKDFGFFQEKFVFTNDLFEKYDSFGATTPVYTYEIVAFNNDGFNAGEAGEGNCGYAVLKVLDAPSYAPDRTGHTILRWQNLESNGTTTVDISEGFYDPDGDFTGVYFDSPQWARHYVTGANNAFGIYSTDCERQ